jgi:acetoin utilization deacetylase AcuC-like enzyme
MKVVYHNMYTQVYSSDPASTAGRIESIYDVLRDDFTIVTPRPASEKEVRLAHGDEHIARIRQRDLTYQVAMLAVGGAIRAAELAVQGETAFGLIRPPGHHASRDSSWGFCYFNNIAISIEKLRRTNKISRALVADIDLHYGDGTDNIFSGTPQVSYFHVTGGSRQEYLENLLRRLKAETECEMVAVSAGFDRHVQDWGGLLETEDYRTIGEVIREFSERRCNGRRYAVLEGGYNLEVLGKNVKSLLEGMK